MVTGSAAHLTTWAAGVSDAPAGCTYLNFTASHDGIGVRPLEGLVPAAEIGRVAEHIQKRGGRVSMKKNSDGTESPYELNCTWFDAMGGAAEDLHLARFLCSQAIPLSLKGVPAVYIHSLTATPNDLAGMEKTGRARSINRRKWDAAELQALLDDKASAAARAMAELTRLLKLRGQQPAFHPDAPQRILSVDDRIFAVERTAAGGAVLCIANCSGQRVEGIRVPNVRGAGAKKAKDLVSGKAVDLSGGVDLEPYQFMWICVSLAGADSAKDKES
jgi:sucrose phosphorylase